ncbi:MAG: hypothetical protein QOK48_3208 [Blastocatellia bacterium]|jgi:hypothetical protein|nr:hypothetical protein [Blastocatellia bacterium]
MKNRLIVLIVLLVTVAFLVGSTAARRQSWEYQQTCTEKDLNNLGASGWELVSATSLPTNTTCFYLKRPK